MVGKKKNTDDQSGMSKKQKQTQNTNDINQQRRFKVYKAGQKASNTDGRGKR